MAILSMLRSLLPRVRRRPKPAKPAAKARPRVETLEARELLAGAVAEPMRVLKQSPNLHTIRELYGDLLNRSPGLTELANWDQGLRNGMSRATMANLFVTSPEYRGNLIRYEYRGLLGREVDPGGLGTWMNGFANGLNIEQFTAHLLGSDEYLQRQGGGGENWLTGLYWDLLGRAPDDFGRSVWLAALGRGTSYSNVALAVATSAEHYGRVIHNSYSQLLHRAPDGVGASTWLTSLQNGLGISRFVGILVASEEFRNYSYNATGTNGRGQVGGIGPASAPLQPGVGDPVAGVHGDDGGVGVGGPPPGSGGTSGGGTSGGGTTSGPLGRSGGTGGTGGTGTSSAGPGGSPGSSGTSSDSPSPRAPNRNASNISASDYAEMSIAVNPTNPNNIVIGSSVVNDLPMLAFYSFDAGTTWTRVVLDAGVDNFGGFTVNRSDPHVLFDANGRLYFSYLLDTQPGDTPAGITALVVLHSTDGGRTYERSYVVQESNAGGSILNDKELLAVGPAPGNPSQQNVYLAWVRFAGLGTLTQTSTILIAGSADGGVNWSPPTQVSDVNLLSTQFPMPGVGPNGEVYVSFWAGTSLTGGATVFIDVSPTFDGGGFSFGTDRRVVSLSHQFFQTTVPAHPFRNVVTDPILAVDNSNGPTRGLLHIIYPDFPGPRSAANFEIYSTTSRDGGLTWSYPLRVNDDQTQNSQFNPWAFVDPTNGCVSASWRDARFDAANRTVHVFAATSSDGGLTYGPNAQISEAPSDVSATTANPGGFLEYDGLAAFGGRLYFAWADNSQNPNGNKAIFFDSIESGCFSSVVTPPPGSTLPPVTPPLAADRFEPNDTSDVATVLGSLGSSSQSGLTIGRKGSGFPDYDWFRGTASRDGQLTASINYTSPESGDLHLRVFTLDARGTLVQLGSSRNTGVTSQAVTVNVTAGQAVLVWVYGFNNVQGNYDLALSL